VEKEPITVILSEKGWIRALKGHVDDLSKLEFKQGDRLRRAVRASTTDKLLLFATNGKFFTLEGSQLPGGRGHGEPVRLMVDLEENHDFVECFVYEPGRRLLVASTAGYGFVVPEDEVVASTAGQTGAERQRARGRVCVPAEGDMVAIIAKPEDDHLQPRVVEMTRQRADLQRYKDGDISDATCS
jgi:topoisomerase-4 subunit A